MDVTASIELSPEQVADAFWNMGSDEQAEFYASLHRIAGGKLCMQAAWIVDGIAELSRRGQTDARDGFMRLQAHAIAYPETAIDLHADEAKREIARYVQGVKESMP